MQQPSHTRWMTALTIWFLVSMLAPLSSFAEEATPVAESSPTATEPPTSTETPVPATNTMRARNQGITLFSDTPLTISINGETEHVFLPAVNQEVIPDIPAGAEWHMYPSAGCTGGSPTDVWVSAGFGFNWQKPDDFWLQARWVAEPTVLSNCLHVTITNSPTMLVAGSTSATTIVSGSNFSVSSSTGSEWAAFQNATCTEDPGQAWFSTERTLEAPVPGTWSFRARLVASHDVTSPCLLVTFVNLPTVTANGSTGPLIVKVSTRVQIATSPGARWFFYLSSDCSGSMVITNEDAGSIIGTGPMIVSILAYLIADPSIVGNCVTITWSATAPITVNGSNGPLTLANGTSAMPEFPEGAQWNVFNGASCAGNPVETWSASTDGVAKSDGTWSFRARWGTDNSTRGNCVTVTWSAKAPITVNGSNGPLTLVNGTLAVPGFPNGAQWNLFNGGSCAGDPIETWSTSTDGVTKSDGTWSFRARWGNDDGTRGNCVAVTWRAAPTLAINGSTTSLTVPIGMTVSRESMPGAELGNFLDSPSCDGDPQEWSRAVELRSWTPRTVSYQLRWAGDDSSRGNCVTVTWEPVSEPVFASEVCGNDNDVITPPKAQLGIAVTDSGWSDNRRTITLTPVDDYRFPTNQQTEYEFTDEGPCVTGAPIPPVPAEVCGVDNDTVTTPVQPANVVVADTGWVNGKRTITFSASADHALPNGTQTEYVFTDEGPCVTGVPIPPVPAEVCGVDNDTVTMPDQPTGVLVADTGWVNGKRTITFSAAEHHLLPTGIQTEYVFTDLGLCVTGAPIPPVPAEVCGVDNDTVTTPVQPANVVVADTGWVNGKRTITFSASADHALPNGNQTEYVFTDEGLCVTAAPIPPVPAEVCGVDNDTVTTPNQPANVLVADTGWVNGKRTITFSAAEHHLLPTGIQTEYVFTDAGPCATDAPLPPVQTAICGPNNDTLTLATDLPIGVAFDSDSEWSSNARTVTYLVDPAYTVTGDVSFTFTDENNPCPPELHPVIVQLETSDGGSVEGAPYALYAPVAAQTVMVTPYIAGVVGAGNQIVWDDLAPGTYRLTVTADGYEPVDEVIAIEDVVGLQTIALRMNLLQVPTPEPTATEPTSAATPLPTEDATNAPTPTMAVSGLPSTGAGDPGGYVWLATGLFGLVLMAVSVGMKRPQRKHPS